MILFGSTVAVPYNRWPWLNHYIGVILFTKSISELISDKSSIIRWAQRPSSTKQIWCSRCKCVQFYFATDVAATSATGFVYTDSWCEGCLRTAANQSTQWDAPGQVTSLSQSWIDQHDAIGHLQEIKCLKEECSFLFQLCCICL